MDWKKFALDVLPVAASLSGNAAVDSGAKLIEDAVNAHLDNQAANSNTTRDALLQRYKEQWNKDIDAADALLKKGHENET